MHAPADQGYQAPIGPDGRHPSYLRAAVNDGVISEATRTSLVRMAKELPYPERSYRRILAASGAEKPPRSVPSKLAAEHRVERKRSDALMLFGW